jgi:NAD(P)-dependent dehydrogenase (short-subunit alcohol dehydrogenase family)
MDLNGKAVLITGAASGIGAATARAMGARGAQVAICDVDTERGEKVCADIGDNARFVELDITDGASWDRGVADIVSAFGKLDIAHLNAGVVMRPYGTPTMEPFFDHLTYANINRIVGINVLGVVLGTAAVLPQLEASKGYLLMTTSPAGMGAWPVDPLYSTTKAAVNTWVRGMGMLLAEKGVRVNALSPGSVVHTRMTTDDWEQAVPGTPIVEPELMADAVLQILDQEGDGGIFLATPDGNITRM